MKTKRGTFRFFTVLCAFASCGVFATSKAALADISEADAVAKARFVLEASGIKNNVVLSRPRQEQHGVPVKLTGPLKDPYETYESDPKGLCYEIGFREGKKSDEGGRVSINIASGQVSSFNWTRYTGGWHVMGTPHFPNRFTLAQCRAIAVTWLQKIGQPLGSEVYLQTEEATRENVYRFEWLQSQKHGNDLMLLPPNVSIEVNALQGCVASLSIRNFDLDNFKTDVAVSRASAVEAARKSLAQYKENEAVKAEAGKLRDVYLQAVDIPAIPQIAPTFTQILEWNVRFTGGQVFFKDLLGKVSGVPCDFLVQVSVTNGQIRNIFRNIRRDELPKPPQLLIDNRFPTWADHDANLLFLNRDTNDELNLTRIVRTASSTRNATNAAKLPAKSSLYTNLLQVESRLSLLSVHDAKIAASSEAQLFLLDTQKGAIGYVGDAESVWWKTPSWSADGNSITFSGTHSGSDGVGTQDFAIFVAELRDSWGVMSQKKIRCVEELRGTAILPTFSGDGKWIVFAHQSQDYLTDSVAWTLYRVPASNDVLRLKAQPKPEVLIAKMPKPSRLSWFPDGNRVLVSFEYAESGKTYAPQIVNVKTKTAVPFKLPLLHDSERPQTALVPCEIAVSESGKKLAFRGRFWDGKPQSDFSFCIYTCNLDGSDLKRITPTKTMPLSPFKYPQSGVTALNVWQKLKPKAPVPTFTKKGDETDFDKWMREHAEKPTPSTPTP